MSAVIKGIHWLTLTDEAAFDVALIAAAETGHTLIAHWGSSTGYILCPDEETRNVALAALAQEYGDDLEKVVEL